MISKAIFCLLALILPIASINATPGDIPVKKEQIVLLGGGIGSLTAAVYIGRAGMSPLVIEGPLPGGLLTQSHMVQNWPGELEIKGWELAEKIRNQAASNGARFLQDEVIAVDFSKRPFVITTRSLDGKKTVHTIAAQSCIVAMGTKSNLLGVPGEKEYWGQGVTNCAVCDGALFKDKKVVVVGGGDAAILEALYLSQIAKEVHVLVRKDTLRAIEEKRVNSLKAKANIHFHYNTAIQEIRGDGKQVSSVVLKTNRGKPYSFTTDGVFLAIGSTPNSAIFANQLQLDKKGYIILKDDQQTSVAGVYAIGDIVDPIYKQAISAAGDGAKAALQATDFLSDQESIGEVVYETVVNTEVAKKADIMEVSSSEQLERELNNSDIPTVVDFYASWCGPCKMIMPTIELSANRLAGKVKFLKVNVDTVADSVSLYNIQAMPTVVLFDTSGKELERKVGPEQITGLLNALESKK